MATQTALQTPARRGEISRALRLKRPRSRARSAITTAMKLAHKSGVAMVDNPPALIRPRLKHGSCLGGGAQEGACQLAQEFGEARALDVAACLGSLVARHAARAAESRHTSCNSPVRVRPHGVQLTRRQSCCIGQPY